LTALTEREIDTWTQHVVGYERQSNNIPQQALCRSSAVILQGMKLAQKGLLPFPWYGWRQKDQIIKVMLAAAFSST